MLANKMGFNRHNAYTPYPGISTKRTEASQPQFSGMIQSALTTTKSAIHTAIEGPEDAYDAKHYQQHKELTQLFTEKKFATPKHSINYDKLNKKIKPERPLIRAFKRLPATEQEQLATNILEIFPTFANRARPKEIFNTPELKALVKETQTLLGQIRQKGYPQKKENVEMLAKTIAKCQVEALKYILMHITVAEQLSVAPFSRSQELFEGFTAIQAAYAKFGLDEALHGEATRFYLINNLGVKDEDIQAQEAAKLGYGVFKSMANLSPSVSVLLMIGLEVVGSTFFKVFADSKYNFEPRFKKLCRDIYTIDEERHLAISQAIYNAMYGRMLIEDKHGPVLDALEKPTFKDIPPFLIGIDKLKPAKLTNSLENKRNHEILKNLTNIWYPQYTVEDHPMLLSMKMLGVDPETMVDTMAKRMKDEFAKVKFEFDLNTFKAIKAKRKPAVQAEKGQKPTLSGGL